MPLQLIKTKVKKNLRATSRVGDQTDDLQCCPGCCQIVHQIQPPASEKP